jgi:NAD(P)-dependent dehydrogenase (short-subunit alcohol dehydrogenase family)
MSNSHSPIALVTGGSRGLGRSVALELAARGADVIITYQARGDAAAEVVRAVEARGRRALALPLDLGKTPSFEAFASEVRAALPRHFGRERFDWLVNNAGFAASAPFVETSEALVDELFTVHFKGTFFLTQRLLPLLVDGGRIVNMSTGLTRYTYPGQAAYAAAKSAVETLTTYLARELGPRRISVNVVAPGGIETDIGGGLMRNPEVQRAVVEQTALGRVGQPEDIGGLVAALLAPETGWVTGQRIEATGGFLL